MTDGDLAGAPCEANRTRSRPRRIRHTSWPEHSGDLGSPLDAVADGGERLEKSASGMNLVNPRAAWSPDESPSGQAPTRSIGRQAAESQSASGPSTSGESASRTRAW